jgi:hypothetical protein
VLMAFQLAKQTATSRHATATSRSYSCIARVQLRPVQRKVAMAAVQGDVPAEVVVQRQVRTACWHIGLQIRCPASSCMYQKPALVMPRALLCSSSHAVWHTSLRIDAVLQAAANTSVLVMPVLPRALLCSIGPAVWLASVTACPVLCHICVRCYVMFRVCCAAAA